MCTQRLIKVVLFGLILFGVGLLYSLFVKCSGVGIPCMIFTFTGFKCPGCGITHMCLALLQMDFKTALQSHPVLFAELPFLLLVMCRSMIRYIRFGQRQLTKFESMVIYICIAVLVFFSIIRNTERVYDFIEIIQR